MNYLNLVYPEKSTIKYKISKFPDGQQNVDVLRFVGREVTIKSRLNNFQDLELIICATKSLRTLGVKEIHLYTPYFLGSRSDRKFIDGGNNYLKDVICPIINSLKFESVTCLDPHSDVLEACLNGFKRISLKDFYDWCYEQSGLNSENIVFVSPDAGAIKRTQLVADQMRSTQPIITCSKQRDVDGKLVIRPDSGDPVDIVCGWIDCTDRSNGGVREPQQKGVIELLWDVFGGTVNEQGYKVLDPHIGAIYGDSITLERAEQICERLKAKGFASTNIVLGIGSYTYQYNTRDTFGFAMKATYGEVLAATNKGGGTITDCREIFKDPITDDGTKKSKKGLLQVNYDDNMNIVCLDQCTWEQEGKGLLQTVFKDGKMVKETTLEEIRNRLK